MAKKIYNKNAREAHLMAEAYQRVHNESAESIEDRFASAVEYAGDVGEFNVQDFLEFKPYIANWDTLLEIIDEENTEGFSERWEEIKFGRSEDAEGDWVKNTPAGREDGNEPTNNRNILGYDWTNLDHETHKMLSMAEDLLGNLDDSGYGELAQRGISGVDDNYDDGAVNMLYNLIDQGWTKGSKAWKLSRKIVDFGLDGLASEDAEEPRHLSALKRMQRDIMNGMTAKESMEGMMIHPSHMRDLLEEYLKWSEEWSEGPFETGFEDAEGVDHISEAIKEMIKTFLDDDKFEGGLQDAFDLTIEQIGDSLGYYTIDNIGL